MNDKSMNLNPNLAAAVPVFNAEPTVTATTAASAAAAAQKAREAALKKRIDEINFQYDDLKSIATKPISDERKAAADAAEAESNRLQAIIDANPDSIEAQMARLQIENLNRSLLVLFKNLDTLAYQNSLKLDAAKNAEIRQAEVASSPAAANQKTAGMLAKFFGGKSRDLRGDLNRSLRDIPARVSSERDAYEAGVKAVSRPAADLLGRIKMINRNMTIDTPESLNSIKDDIDCLPADFDKLSKAADGLTERGDALLKIDEQMRKSISTDNLPPDVSPETHAAIAAALQKAFARIGEMIARLFGRAPAPIVVETYQGPGGVI
ncbi:MAG: hypothetical protein P4M02_04575 [Clostridia bacterium]|nr:hypothetical protein [Clostridia bacterium]